VAAKTPVKKVAVKAVAKPVAKTVAAKTPVKKVAVKAVAKPVAKAVVAKTAVKKVAVKAVAKPVAKTVVAKTPVKKVAVKAVAKPVAKTVVAKTVVKKVTVKAVAKPVAKTVVAKTVLENETTETSVAPVLTTKAPDVVAPILESEASIEDLPESVTLAAKVLFKLRAEKVQVIDLRGHSDIADFFVVGTCSSEAQMQAILTGLQREYKTAKLENYGIEYREGVRWAVFDGIETMVHLFEEGARSEYSLERLWRDGKLVDLKEEDYQQASVESSSDDDFV
jgi:ribosome-associated protein